MAGALGDGGGCLSECCAERQCPGILGWTVGSWISKPGVHRGGEEGVETMKIS